MKFLRKLYRKTGWHTVFSFADEAARARTYLLGAVSVQGVVNGLTTGVFYTGFLMCFGINIVNISILTIIPQITSLFTLLTPFVLDRFPKRRFVVSVARIFYYAIRILGVTLLPRILTDPTARVAGLICVVFLSNAIDRLFAGYNPWHMPYITPEIRTGYLSATSLVSNLVSTFVALAVSWLTERINPDHQVDVFTVLRLLAFGLAMLDVYFLQKPKEPEYLMTTRPSLLNIIKLPIRNKKFMLTMLVNCIYTIAMNASSSLQNTWMLQEVKMGYFYISLINGLTPVFILFTSGIWNRVMRKMGNFKALSFYCGMLGVSVVAHSFVNEYNYLWLNTAVRLFQQSIAVLGTYTVGNLIYINLPKEDQTSFISFHGISSSLAAFISMSIGTWVVAAMGENTWTLLGHKFTGVPTLLFAQGLAAFLVGFIIMVIRKEAEPEGRNM